MIWNPFRRTTRPSDPHAGWWADADRAGREPTPAAIDALAAALAPAHDVDAREQQEEMLDGLRALVALASADLPVVLSQHRVIGADTCHLIAPVTFGGVEAAPGKLFLTSRRLIVVTGGVTTRPWHATRRFDRLGRLLLAGSGESALEIRCNSFGDALASHHIGTRLMAAGRT